MNGLKMEFGNWYKAVTSVGIGLFALSLLVPLIVSRECGGMMLVTQRASQLTPEAKRIWHLRHRNAEWVLVRIPYIFGVLAVVGLATTTYGLWRWHEEEELHLRQLRADVEESERKLTQRCVEEVRDDKEADLLTASEDEPAGKPETVRATEQMSVESALSIERRFAEVVRRSLRGSHKVLTDRQLGKAMYDLIAWADSETHKDYLIDLKIVRRGFGYAWVRDNISRMILGAELYRAELKRAAIPVLVFVIPDESSTHQRKDEFKARAAAEAKRMGASVLIHFYKRSEFDALDVEAVRKALRAKTPIAGC